MTDSEQEDEYAELPDDLRRVREAIDDLNPVTMETIPDEQMHRMLAGRPESERDAILEQLDSAGIAFCVRKSDGTLHWRTRRQWERFTPSAKRTDPTE